MHNLVESATYTATVPVPDDAVDLRTAASLLGAFQAVTNRTKFIFDSLFGATAVFAHDVLVAFTLTADQLTANSLVDTFGLTAHGPTTCTTITASGTITAPTVACTGVSSAVTMSCTNVTASANVFCGFLNSSNGGVVNTAPLFCNAGVIGKHSWPAVTLAATGASTCNVDQAQVFICTPTANKTAQITEGALTVDGDEIEFATYAAGFTLTILDTVAAGGGTILTMKNASGFSRYARYKRIAGVWRLLNDRAVP